MSARKDDKDKPPMSLIPRSALIAEARVMAHGAKRYGPHNWRGGMRWSRLLDAAMRHITAFADGENIDDGPDGTGESHLANARCCLAFVIEYAEKGLGEDDRHNSHGAEGDEGAEGAVTASAADNGVRLVILGNGPESLLRYTVENELILSMPSSSLPAGTVVWARPRGDGALMFVDMFDGVPS